MFSMSKTHTLLHMRTVLCFSLLLLGSFFATVHAASFPRARAAADSTVGAALLGWSPKALEEATGKKLRWHGKLALKMVQKKLRKGAQEEAAVSQSAKVLSVVSLVAGALTVGALLVGTGIGFLLFALAGLITGIIALAGNRARRNRHRTLAILGVVLSGGMILLVLAVILAWAAAWN